MTPEANARPRYLSWKAMAFTVLVMIGAIVLGLLLIPQLSVRAAIRGGVISIGMFLAVRLGQRFVFSRRRR